MPFLYFNLQGLEGVLRDPGFVIRDLAEIESVIWELKVNTLSAATRDFLYRCSLIRDFHRKNSVKISNSLAA